MDKKQRLAKKFNNLRNLEQSSALCNGDKMDIDDHGAAASGQMPSMTEHTLAPLSDEWFADLDESFNKIDKLLEELQHERTQSLPHDCFHILGTDQRLLNMQGDFTQCLTTLQAGKRQQDKRVGSPNRTPTRESREADSYDISSESDPSFVRTPKRLPHAGGPRAPTKLISLNIQLSPGESVMKQLFRWWQPCGSDCIHDVRRLGGHRRTEVDGRVQ